MDDDIWPFEPTPPTTPGIYVRRVQRAYWVAIVVDSDGAVHSTQTYAMTKRGAERQGRRHARSVAAVKAHRTGWIRVRTGTINTGPR